MSKITFQGSFTAIVTPFRSGQVDEERFRGLIDFQIENGINGIVPCGTTGESPTLSHDEHKQVIRLAVEQAAGRVSVIAGTGSNSTQEAKELTLYAKQVGADAALVITPYYNKPTQTGLEAHFRDIAQVGLPIVIYNVPSRTGINISPATVAALSKLPSIVGIKEASGSMDQASGIIASCGPDFSVLSGDDSCTLPLMALGGRGVISVLSNLLPAAVTDMVTAWLEGNGQEAMRLHYKLFPLFKAMFIETNPLPVKTAMAKLKMIPKEWRLPLVPMLEKNEHKLELVMQEQGLL